MKKYDLIFGIGEACLCTQVLRNMNLQFCSYPFDWLHGCSMENRLKIIVQGFKDFINKEDLEYLHEEKNINCNAYYNRLNHITFNHDFSKDIPFDEAYEEVKQKYERRSKRLIKQISKAHSILIVYIETPNKKHEVKEESVIIKAFDSFNVNYPDKKIDLFYIKNIHNQENVRIKNISKNITLFEFDYKKKSDKLDFLLDMDKLCSVFYDIKLKNSSFKIIKTYIRKIDIYFILVKKLIQKLKIILMSI